MIVVDTDVIIDFLRARPGAQEYLAALEGPGEVLAIAAPSIAELWRGAASDDAALAGLLGGMLALPFDESTARRCGRMMQGLERAGRAMPLVDAMIAATALEHGAPLATRNVRHYKRVADLRVISP